tara:strand:+ start:55 stop:1050 length:996 start_codon:yes stop_codon:yes gene_type:complete
MTPFQNQDCTDDEVFPRITGTPNVISVSSGKDSTAMMLLAREKEVKNLSYVIADTGNEHEDVWEYLDYLRDKLNVEIKIVKADFSRQIEGKREYIKTKWRAEGVDEKIVQSALGILHPTGNPFLDMCMWKGRFPSSQAQFCTGELKTAPILKQIMIPLLKEYKKVRSWQGLRWDESRRRSSKAYHERLDLNIWAYRPLLHWTADDVFAIHKKHGIKPNPLYLKGMGRVGCMPCINCRKDELSEISSRFPDVIERLREWESLVSQASKRGSGTFFAVFNNTKENQNIHYKTHGIDACVAWSKTVYGGKQFDLFKQGEKMPSCSSNYGLCETS